MSHRVWHVSLLSLVMAARVFMGEMPPACAAASQTEPKTVQFFVSPQGDDAWSGRLADPAVSDGPFATIGRAQQAVREVRKTCEGTVRVVLRSGTYYLDQPLEFGPEDSGKPCGSMGEGEYPTTYAAAAGEQAIISGGRRLQEGHWGEVNGHKAWVVDIPEVKDGTWNFTQLFVNGERRPRTRLPKEGYYHIKAVPGRDPGQGSDDIDGDRRFIYAAGDIEPWHNLQDVEIVSAATCVASRLHILSVSEEQRLVTFDRTSRGPLMYGGRPVYWVENVLEALDTPGQWYLDRPLGRLYYLPKAGEDMEKAEIIAPRLPQLVHVAGTKKAPVKHLRFEGITFSHTEWQEPPDWPKEGRYTGAWYDIPAAIRFTHATRCSVTGCVIEHGVAYGVEVREGSREVEISRNRMSDLGAGGVKIWFNSARTTVADNEIGHTGMIFLTSYGILVGDSPGNQIIYNHIYDRHYTGILVGWAMQFEESNAYGNVVEHNHIHDIGRGVMSDMGGIYTEGICAGTRIRYNLVHDIQARLWDNNGIYHDSGADILVEKNLVYRCTPLHIHYTRNIALENNIFALGEAAQVTRAGVFDRPLLEYTFRRNIIYFNQGRVVGSWNLNNRNCVYDRNLYWNASGKAVLFGGKTFAEWQAAGQDKNSVIADPLFIAPEEGDFRLRQGSPAARIGFEPWDLTTVGPRHHSGTSKQKLVSALGDAGSAPPRAVPSVGKHKMLELIFTAAGTPVSPFDTYLLKLEVTDPAGRIFTVEGFYDGDGSGGQAGQTWKVRLCPYRTGRWTWRTVPGDAPDGGLEGLSGQFDCVESGDLGGLVAQEKYFRLQDGDFFFPVGNFLDHAGGLPLWSYLGETVTDAQRDAIIRRHRDFHTANKYMFYMSNHSDSSGEYSEVVTPWVGTSANSDKTKMDLSRWKLYDGYLRRMKDSGLSAYMSLFEDGKPGNYGRLPMAARKRFMRYAMARTSAFSHLWYVLCFEWQEAWSKTDVNEAGRFIQAHNPWKRLLSVHDWAGRPWAFVGATWPTYIASQDGNDANPDAVNSYVISLRAHGLPVLADELGSNRTDSDARIRGNMWAAFCAGAAGTGTGTDLRAFQRFLAQSRIPYQRMEPSNELVQGGGSSRFCLAESGHHYLVYSTTGSFAVSATGAGLAGRWFNPRDPNASLGTSFAVSSGTSTFTPPDTACDWALWVTDGSNLNNGVTRLTTEATVIQVVVGGAEPN